MAGSVFDDGTGDFDGFKLVFGMEAYELPDGSLTIRVTRPGVEGVVTMTIPPTLMPILMAAGASIVGQDGLDIIGL